MEEQSLNNLANKLKRLNVDYRFHNNTLILKGTSLSKMELFLSIILPIAFFILFLVILIILINSLEIDKVVFPKAIFIIPLLLLYYGIKNLLKLRKNKNNQYHFTYGKLILITKKNEKIIFSNEDIIEFPIKIEENYSNIVGEIYVRNFNNKYYLLLSLIGNDLKYLKDDLDFIKNAFLMILNSNKKNRAKSKNLIRQHK